MMCDFRDMHGLGLDATNLESQNRLGVGLRADRPSNSWHVDVYELILINLKAGSTMGVVRDVKNLHAASLRRLG